MTFYARPTAISAVRQCEDWPELFDLMKDVLGSMRKGWGDRDKYFMFAATTWAKTSFCVVSPEVMAIENHRVSGPAVTRAAFELARELAVTLLSPLKVEADWSGPGGVRERTSELLYGVGVRPFMEKAGLARLKPGVLASNRYQLAVQEIFHAPVTGEKLTLETLSERRKAKLDRNERGFIHESIVCFRDEHELDDFLQDCLYQSKPVSEGLDHPLHTEFLRMSTAEMTDFCEDFGFTHLRFNPVGGWDKVCEAMLQMEDACIGLQERIQAPATIVGQQQLALSLNEPRSGFIAYFMFPWESPTAGWKTPMMGFTHSVQSVGHEWTHAMEYLNQKRLKERSGMTLAYGQLHPHIESLPLDPQIGEVYLADLSTRMEKFRTELKNDFIGFLAESGSPSRKAAAVHDHALLPHDEEIYNAFLLRAETEKVDDIVPEMKEWLTSLGQLARVNWAGEVTDRIDAKFVLTAWSERLKSVERQKVLLSQNKPVFLIDAWERTTEKRWSIGKKDREIEYYMQPHELLARTAEAVFHDENCPRLGFVAKRDFSSPKGEELGYLEPWYEAWLDGIKASWEQKLEKKATRRSKMGG
jgi:hypothetical protein